MEKAQAINLVEETFTQKFDKNQFLLFIRNLLNRLDESEGRQKLWTKPVIKNAFAGAINHYERLGTYTDPHGERLDVLVIHLKKETSLERARTFLRNFVADYLTTGHGQGKSAVLAAFVSPNPEDWRFSFIKLEYSLEQTDLGFVAEKKELTPARRYSFLVGSNERSHTAQKQFLSLLQNDQTDPLLAELEEAFSVEKVTREFFEQYKDLFEKLEESLDVLIKQDSKIQQNFAECSIDTPDFAEKLLGQIVFLYFLQKKGWFGVERDATWGTGNKRFLRYLFDHRAELTRRGSKSTKPDSFFNDVLEPLFYEALATERTGNFYSRFDCKIPFLNGGLFDPLNGYDWVHTDIFLPDSIFSNEETNDKGDKGTGILDVFDRYNFTVNEAEPLEKEVAVDPEMLGKVFENLLPENLRHKGGTYYTPRVIVHYMCQQSLINYLSTHLRELGVDQKEIEAFIRIGERFADFEANPTEKHRGKLLPKGVRDNAAKIDRLLADIAVCDPAIGSGAFPVGMMQEIVRARLTLASIPSMPKHSAYELKRHAIQNCLYGVDIDSTAVEIAKLRLWLSLVVDEDDIQQIRPLPNLDYKIMQGDSLLDEFEGVKLLDDRFLISPEADIEQQKAELDRRISQLSSEFIDLHSKGPKFAAQRLTVENEVKRLKKQQGALTAERQKPAIQGELTDPFSEARKKLALLKSLHQEFFDLASPEQKRKKRQELESLEWEFMEATLREQQKAEALQHLRRLRHANRKPFFLWKLHFVEIFQGKGGFDVVLANPPYVRQEQIKELKPALQRSYVCYTGVADLYVYFYECGVRLLNQKGSLTFISSNKYFRAGYGEKLRRYLSGNTRLDQVIDFGDTPIFEATTYPCIVVLRRQPVEDNQSRVLSWNPKDPIDTFEQKVHAQSFRLPQSYFSDDSWRLEPPKVLQLFDRLKRTGKPLGEYVQGRFYYGIKTGLNEAFVVDRTTRDRLVAEHPSSAEILKPFLRGRDVKRWRVDSPDLWLIFTRRGIDIKKYPAIRAHLKEHKARLMPGVPGGRKPGSYQWYEIQDNIAYWKEFQQPKVIVPAIERLASYALDNEGYFSNDKTSICIAPDPRYVLAVLNSKLHWWLIQHSASTKQGGFYEFKPMYVAPLPIPTAAGNQKRALELLVEYIVFLKVRANRHDEDLSSDRDHLMLHYFEQLIDGMVYELLLKEELAAAGKTFFEPFERENFPCLDDIPGNKLQALQTIFERLSDQNHIIRQYLFFLDTLEEVRIIEGKP